MAAPGPDGLSSKACIVAYAQMDIRHPERVRINSRGSAGSKRNGNSLFQERGGQPPKYKGMFPVSQVNADSGTVGNGGQNTAHPSSCQVEAQTKEFLRSASVCQG